MQVRYYDDPRSRQPHIYGHNVAEHEVEAVLDRPMERPSRRERSENRARAKRTQVVIYESFMFQTPFRTRSS